jgi:uncharacterized membrane protein (DUF4010 family)
MFETAKPFLLSLALGLVLGIERERAAEGKSGVLALGSRTFALIALLGTLAAHLGSPGVAVVLAAFVAAIAIASYVRVSSSAEIGTTTEIAAVATFALGFIADREPKLAAMLGVIVLAVLWLKPRIHAFAHEGLTDQEVKAALTFLVIALVVLPLLPDRTVDPWSLINPARLWLLFVVIAGIGFGGYIAVRALGPARGLPAAGFAAGLVSSTAATLSLARQAHDDERVAGPLATGIVLANVASAAAQVVVASVANPDLTGRVAAVLSAPVLVGVVGALAAHWWFRRRAVETADASFRLANPLNLKPAVAMAAAFAFVLLVAALAVRTFGGRGVVGTAAVVGTTDVHAATLAAATLAASGAIVPNTALLAILVAFVVNMAVKLGIAIVAGTRRLALLAAPPMVLMAASAVVAFLVLAR